MIYLYTDYNFTTLKDENVKLGSEFIFRFQQFSKKNEVKSQKLSIISLNKDTFKQ